MREDAGAIFRAARAGLDIDQYLSNNDAYPFFEAPGDLLITGPAGTHVMDMNVVLICRPRAG